MSTDELLRNGFFPVFIFVPYTSYGNQYSTYLLFCDGLPSAEYYQGKFLTMYKADFPLSYVHIPIVSVKVHVTVSILVIDT